MKAKLLVDPLARDVIEHRGYLSVRYPAAVVDGAEVFTLHKQGVYDRRNGWRDQSWSIRKHVIAAGV